MAYKNLYYYLTTAKVIQGHSRKPTIYYSSTAKEMTNCLNFNA